MSTQKNVLLFATGNAHKVKEINHLLANTNYVVQSLKDVGYSKEIIEDGETIEENAIIKARTLAEELSCDALGEDTGLEIEALDMAPGVHTAHYAGKSRDAQKNMAKVLKELGENENRRARFKTIIALVKEGQTHLFEGIVNGTIAPEVKGIGGFGYDPIFIPDGYCETFAELPLDEKSKISHRSRAVKALISFLESDL